MPGVWLEDMTFHAPGELDNKFHIGRQKTIVNVGSVGQPRDNDPRACYALFDGASVEWVKLPYDFETTIKKIYDTKDLDPSLGDRLREGR